jgi:hypothetical protein
MKIRTLLTIAALVFSSSQALAKKNDIKSSTEEKLVESLDVKKDSREEIAAFDYQKLFADTEGFFRAAKAWKKIKCEPKNGFICTKHTCNKKESAVHVVLDKVKETITRCEGKYCESFPAKFSQTGVFYNIQSDGPVGTLIRVLGDSRYKEITTVGLDAYIANGECQVTTE